METFPNSYFQNAVSISQVSNEKRTFSLPVKTPPLPLWDTLLFSISFRKYLLGSTMLILSLQKRLDNLEKFSLHSRKTCNSSLSSITLSTLPQNAANPSIMQKMSLVNPHLTANYCKYSAI